ncbi:uncharacterized protein LOC132194490 [Neocloeon triangulifer]|uniref:uncharacterized protein LOC132194490 n=1 Tax=Neocloeon triangulifer TaxID=2078957 RepID=UPI00286EEF3B|nr:uncharacterized protein LOC132194490 [Neocloeon triangulifer]
MSNQEVSQSKTSGDVTDDEAYYNQLYERAQYRKSKSAKCAKKLEQMQESKINRVKSAKVVLPWHHYASKHNQKLESRLKSYHIISDCEDFFRNVQVPISDLKDLNVELRVQRLVRKVEEIKEVQNQLVRQKDNDLYKILNPV